MPNAIARNLKRFGTLCQEELAGVVRAAERAERLPRGTDLVRQGEPPQKVPMLLTGWACRYKSLTDGGRQIVGFMLPGDICDGNVTLVQVMDHSIGLLTEARVAVLARHEMQALLDRHEGITHAIWCTKVIEEAVLREWLTNVGQRDALHRTAHLLCELWHRLDAVGLIDSHNSFEFPLTQEELGEALGLTAVHVNRTLRRLKMEGFVQLERKRLRMLDLARLSERCGFDPTYLFLSRDKARRELRG